MECTNDTSFFDQKSRRGVALEVSGNRKRKNACQFAARIRAATRHGAKGQFRKRIRPEGTNHPRKLEGSVAYGWLSSDAYGWPSKISFRDAGNFQKSGIPSRFMYFEKGEWKNFSADAVSVLCATFRAGKPSVEFSVDDNLYLVNFVQMMQVNMTTCFVRSIAWIDERERCFFPTKVVEGHEAEIWSQFRDRLDSQLQLDGLDSQRLDCEDLISRSDDCSTGQSVENYDSSHGALLGGCPRFQKGLCGTNLAETSEITSNLRVGGEALGGSDVSTTRGSHDFTLLGDKLVKLEQGDQEFITVRSKFLAGLGLLVTYTSVVGIYRDSHTSTSGLARLQAFRKQFEVTRQARGDANVRYAWHGTSKPGVSGIVLHGFGQPKTPKNGAVYGVGVYLAPEEFSHVSAVYSDIDENGEQHMVLCSVIMGKMEQVQPGSEQFHPSSEDYDTGVDDLGNPKRYIIWSTHMNTHILPQYVVSFKLSPQWHSVLAALRGKSTVGRGPSQIVPEQSSQPKMEGSASVPLCQGGKVLPSQFVSVRRSSIKAPRSPWMSFPILFLVLKTKIPPADMTLLHRYYLEFKAGLISREMLIRNVRAVTGDTLLANSIKNMQAQDKLNQNGKLESSLDHVAPAVPEANRIAEDDYGLSIDQAVC